MIKFKFIFLIYIRAVIKAFSISFLLYRINLPSILEKIDSNRATISGTQSELQEIARITVRVCKWRLFLIRNNCLRRSLLLYTMLSGAGIKGLEINIGISKEGKGLMGHGWLMLNGKPFLEEYEDSLNQYTVMYKHGDMI
jgi:hypothetical protein